ncbi:glycosyl transferase [Nostoc sp. 'Peltigera membranacea cyanobiont' 210A]|uniref:glycosyltransferase family protein n=1 Tax=Nostoc sp. 'Peltigera membranacea cyanobiont' 210A TaxID=2014529 RepID=UPI000B95485B|nr:glycosyltransferase [Nostoc sp. 'Peltigera membranacea cyanobiont' 210A]OYD97587.1 glycosyl transferase [Nostoc sp. 'Peltigera membranacea cyanobiont' 210A]
MKRIMFYCQHILGMGHLVRSREIVRGLTKDFQVCFINGGEIIQGFEIPAGVEVINLPAIKTDPEFAELQVVDDAFSLNEVQEIRKNRLLEIFQQFQPDILIVELFPFGRRRFSFELIPLLELAKSKKGSTKIVSSLRDIVAVKPEKQVKHEEKVCKLINKYFDMLLVHSDPELVPLEATFSRVNDLKCQVYYTGYVVQEPPRNPILTDQDREIIKSDKPLILASVGGGRFGHELLECVVNTAPFLEKLLPHQIQVFTGPFIPNSKFKELQQMAKFSKNIYIRRYTPYLLNYMKKAELSINMSGYNTTMNILTTGVRAMILPFTGNQDREQTIRAEKLSNLGIVKFINHNYLQPDYLAINIINYLKEQPNKISFDSGGVEKTATILKALAVKQKFA